MNLGGISLMLLQKAGKGRNTNPNSTVSHNSGHCTPVTFRNGFSPEVANW